MNTTQIAPRIYSINDTNAYITGQDSKEWQIRIGEIGDSEWIETHPTKRDAVEAVKQDREWMQSNGVVYK